MIRTTERTSRKRRSCGCGNVIQPGDRYVEHVASPGHEDLDNTRWWRLPECEECAIRYGRLAAEAAA